MKVSFTLIHRYLRRGKLSIALELLVNSKTNRINSEFQYDKNHAWYCVGDIFYRQSHFREAKDAFKRSLYFRIDDIEALTAIGNCYDELGRPKLAERYFRRALGHCKPAIQNVDHFSIKFNLANALFDQNRIQEAILLYRQLSKAPESIKLKAKKNEALAKLRLKK